MTTHANAESLAPPILKIGAVVLRGVVSKQGVVSAERLKLSEGGAASVPLPSGEAARLSASALSPSGEGDAMLGCASPHPASPNPDFHPSLQESDGANPTSPGGRGSPAAPLLPVASHQSPVASNYGAHEILIIQPIPKHAGEVPPFVLPRGSRQYCDAQGVWHDARDAATGAKHADTLEPFTRALAREIEEEAGVSGDMLARARVNELGAMAFQSRTKGNYPIHWFVVMPTAKDAALLDGQTPADATAVRWATLDEIKVMAARGEFSAGYVPVIEAALHALHTNP